MNTTPVLPDEPLDEGVPVPLLAQGPVARTLVRLTLPMLVAMLAMAGFNIVDTFYLGQLGTAQLAAMGFTLAVVMTVSSISMGLGVGTTAVISRVIGRGDGLGMQRLSMNAILLGLLVAMCISVVGLVTIDPLFRLMGATGIVLDHIHAYMAIWFLGLPLVIVPQIGNSAIRATGDTKTPALIMISAMTANAVLDPLFIFGLGPVAAMGMQGAAIATVLSQAIALIVSFNVLLRRGLITFARQSWRELADGWRRILTIGVPAAVTQLITPVSTGIVIGIVATYGIAAVAGFGVASRLEMFAVMVINALGSALVPFIGQNWGAGNKERVGRAVKVALALASGWGLMVWLLSIAFGRPVASIFNDNPLVIATVMSYMAIVFPSLFLLGALTTVNSALNALHKPLVSMMLSLVRMLVLYVPLAFLGSALMGLTGVWWAAFAANVASGIVAVVWFRRIFHDLERGLPPAAKKAGEPLPAAS
ncbi:MAG: MATE family efflux transporter [Actinobacteria bacterium HGW-Actinobacteria-7]|nr:MAG: MATE family efflux transporter [Actinobacteria bacterium HGW-Actinobacteria-7]